MSDFSIEFEMSDALISQAVREDCVAFAKEHVTLWDLLAVMGSAAVFALALARESHWLWWIAGLPPGIFVVLSVGWLFAYLWLPRYAKSRLAHLPHRHVRVEASETVLAFVTATERLEVAWPEVKALKRRPGFWIVGLRSGMRIPIPAAVVGKEAVALLQAKLATFGQPGRKVG